MNRTIASITSVLILLSAATIPAHSQDSGNDSRACGFLMLEEPVNPRDIAMGSAGAALGGAGFRYYNPVRPFFAAAPYVTAEFGQMPGGVNLGGFETALISPEWFSAISFHSSSVDFGLTDERGQLGAAASSGTTFGALTFGYIRDNLAAGVSVNIAEDRIWVENSYTAVAASAGLGYKTPDGRLNLGAAAFHYLARSRGFEDNPYEWGYGRVPKYIRAGAAWSDSLKSIPYTAAADLVYRNEDGTLTVPVGLEVKVLPSVSLRIGKRIGWESEIISLGIGLNIDRISFDAAFVPAVFVDDYEIKWRMGLSYSLGKRRKLEAPVIADVEEAVEVRDVEEVVGEEKAVEETEEAKEAEAGGKDVSTDKDAGTDESAGAEKDVITDKDAGTDDNVNADKDVKTDNADDNINTGKDINTDE